MNESQALNPEKGLASGEYDFRDVRALETLVESLQQKDQTAAPKQKEAFKTALFQHPNIKRLLESCDIKIEDSFEEMIQKINARRILLEREKRTVRPEVSVKEVAPGNDHSYEEVTDIQEEINEFYRLNNEISDEQDHLKEEMLFIEMFRADKEEEPLNIELTNTRIAQYEEEIRGLPSVKTKSFLGRLLQDSDQVRQAEKTALESLARKAELDNKILRAIGGLDDSKKQLETKEGHWRNRLHEMQEILGISEKFEGSWQEMVTRLTETIQKLLQKLDTDFESNKSQAEALEQQRDTIEDKKSAA